MGYLIGMARLVGANVLNVLRHFVRLTRDCIDEVNTGTHEQAASLTID